jgi:hypothetical protein
MNKTDETLREFNGRIFIKGKCYNFDQVYTYDEPINDKIITSSLWHGYQYIKSFIIKFLEIIFPFKVFKTKKEKQLTLIWSLILLIVIVGIVLMWFFLFAVKKC